MGTKLPFTARALRAGERREAGHLIPAPGSVMGKWKSHNEKGGGGGPEKVRRHEREIKREGGQQVRSKRERMRGGCAALADDK